MSSTGHFPHSVSMSSIAPCPLAFNARPLIWSLETRDNLQYQAFVDQTEEQKNKETKKNNNNILTVKKKKKTSPFLAFSQTNYAVFAC